MVPSTTMCWHMIRFYHILSNDSLMLEVVEKEEEEEEEAEEVLSKSHASSIFLPRPPVTQ